MGDQPQKHKQPGTSLQPNEKGSNQELANEELKKVSGGLIVRKAGREQMEY
jgi:hypothetical protein